MSDTVTLPRTLANEILDFLQFSAVKHPVIDELAAALAAPQLAVAWQYRTKPTWDDRIGWGEWQLCRECNYQDYLKAAKREGMDWVYETRALYVAVSVQPATARGAT